MKIRTALPFALAIGLAAAAARSAAIRYETVPDDGTVLFDDTEAVLMQEYALRAKESMVDQKGRTAAAQLRRVAALAERAAGTAFGEAQTALVSIQRQALRLAYAAERNSDSADRRVREFVSRTENFLGGEWALLEAKHFLSRGDTKTARVFLTVAQQQMARRAQRLGKVRGVPFQDAADEVKSAAGELDLYDAARIEKTVADLVKTARELAPAPAVKSAKGKPRKTEATSGYSTDYGDYGTDTTYSSNDYGDTSGKSTGQYGSAYDDDETGVGDTDASDASSTGTKSSGKKEESGMK